MPLGNSSELPWFAIYVKSRHEKAVSMSFAAKNIQSFLPTYAKVYKKGRRAEVPVFPGYVFCRLDIWNPLAVMTTPGVFSIVSHGATPSPIPDWEIENVRRMIDSNLNVRPWPEVKPGSDFTIPSGPLRGVQGIVENTGDERWLIVSVQLLRKGIGVKLDPACVYGL